MGQSDRNLSGESCPLRDSFLSESFLRRLPFVDGAAGWGSAWTGSERWRC